MTKTAPPKHDGLEQKFRLLALLPYDERAKRKHSLVFGFVLDWYHSKYGDALASVRHVVATLKERDPAGKGMSLPHVHSALSDLVAWGYLEQTLGGGKRASRYVPNWSRLQPSVTPAGNANDNDPSVTPGVNTSVTPGVNATTFAVTPVGNEDLPTPTRAQDPGTGIGRIDCATPTAPLADGLGATAARTAQGDGFDRLWNAYSHRQRKAEARAAFDKLAPNADLLEQMVAAAGTWFAAWSAQNKPDAPRFNLKNWIEREEYECEPPTAYKPKERKASARKLTAAMPSTQQKPAKQKAMFGSIDPFSTYGSFEAEITSADVTERSPGEHTIRLEFEWDEVKSTWHEFPIESPDPTVKAQGRAVLDSIIAALGLTGDVEETDDLLFRKLQIIIEEPLVISYAPVAANDNGLTAEVA